MKIPSRSSKAVSTNIEKSTSHLGDRAYKIFKSITADNGSEFATLTNTVPFLDVYFTNPYSSFKRGTNEKQNSMLRRFFPKNKSLDNVSDQAIKAAQDWIRSCLKNKNCTKKENDTKYKRMYKDKLTDKKWYIVYYNTYKSHHFT